MIKIAICDDDEIFASKLYDLLLIYEKNNSLVFEIEVFTNTDNLIKNSSLFEVIFLDVEIGSKSGIEVGRDIRKYNKEVNIIYVSGFVQYAPAGYNVKAFAYIIKQNIDALLASTLDDLFEEIKLKKQVVTFTTNKENVEIILAHIIFIESYGRQIFVHLKDSEEPIYTNMRLKEIMEILQNKGFVQIHKSYIVNIDYISELKNYKAKLTSGTSLPASQRKWQESIKQYVNWKGRI